MTRLLLIAAALAAVASPAFASPAAASPAAAPGAAAKSGMTSAKVVPDAAPAPVVKASKAERIAALRMEPLAQVAFFNREFERDPTDIEAGLGLSDALRALGRYTEAGDIAHRILIFAPKNEAALLAAARAHIADNNAFFAVDPLQQVIAQNGRDWRAYSLLGVAYDQIKRGDEAQAMWAQALKLSPENPSVLTNQAMFLAARGDLAEAEALLRRAVAQRDATIQVRQNLALVLGMQGKLPEAEKLLRQDLPPDVADRNLAWLQASLKPAAAPASQRSWDSLKGG